MAPSTCAMKGRIAFAIIGIVVGVSIFASFGTHFKNYDTALWGLASGVFAAICLYVHCVYYRNEWITRPGLLKPLMLLGCFGQLAGVCSFAVYLALAISEHQAVTGYGRGYYVTSVWSAMTWKWGFLLFYYSRSYKRLRDPVTIVSQTPYQKI